jgi:purine nucleosidase
MRIMKRVMACGLSCVMLASMGASVRADGEKRMVIADQDASGPGGSDMTSLLVFLQSPQVDLLGITVVTGDAWRDVEVAHTLRLLETVGRTDVKVYPGAAFPLVRTQEETAAAEALYGKNVYKGAWGERTAKDGYALIPPMREGAPVTKPADEDAAHFMVRMVHTYPHQVTIYGAGPLTNIALAIKLDPQFAELAQELVVMGGSIAPQTERAEWTDDPRHEFNFWFDPEAASITLRAKWAKVTVTTIDVSLKTRFEPEVLAGIQSSTAPAAVYAVKYLQKGDVANYLWDELAACAWLDPSLITKERDVYMNVNTDRGAEYGDTMIWTNTPPLPTSLVHAQMDVDLPRLQGMLVKLLTSATPGRRSK